MHRDLNSSVPEVFEHAYHASPFTRGVEGQFVGFEPIVAVQIGRDNTLTCGAFLVCLAVAAGVLPSRLFLFKFEFLGSCCVTWRATNQQTSLSARPI